MARKKSLPPGFRFHPTDTELVMYYLKRKVMGKKLHAEAIAEVNIYKFSPWELPDMSCLKSKDLEWFFFCPRERKYTIGVRVKRATENGYWKITGKDRPVYYDDKTVGTVKTLVFHLGHAPQGERTDWVIHEYRILDEQLAASGLQDTYALCKLFKKNGPGPKNGAQYGAPFNEEDWSDDDIDISESALLPEVPSLTALLPESASVDSVTEEGSNRKQKSVVTASFQHGSTSGLSSIQGGLAPSTGPIASQLLEHESDDDFARLLASFRDDTSLLVNGNGNHEDHHNGNRENQSSILGLDGYDIYSELQDLNNSAPMDEQRLYLSGMRQDNDYTTLYNVLDDLDYIELNDLIAPLSSFPEIGNDQLCDTFGSSNHNNVPQLCFAGTDQPTSCINQLPVLPDQSYKEETGYGMLHEGNQVNNQFYQESNAVYGSTTHTQSSNWENAGCHFDQYMDGGR